MGTVPCAVHGQFERFEDHRPLFLRKSTLDDEGAIIVNLNAQATIPVLLIGCLSLMQSPCAAVLGYQEFDAV
jgi:hypothetical protein